MPGEEGEYLLTHRGHDFEYLVSRWKGVAKAANLGMDVVAEGDEMPVFVVENEFSPEAERGLYVSAGIHGDEPAAAQGLIDWAESNIEFLSRYPVTIFPCLNPWGFVNNCRLDGQGRDINRIFDRKDTELVRQLLAFLKGRRYRLALCLHEDYDAQGVYVYELARGGDGGVGELFLKACEEILPRHPGDGVEGRAAEAGVISPPEEIEEVLREIDGMPEAILLFLEHTDISLTFETPSEYSIFQRVRAQKAVLDAAVALLEG